MARKRTRKHLGSSSDGNVCAIAKPTYGGAAWKVLRGGAVVPPWGGSVPRELPLPGGVYEAAVRCGARNTTRLDGTGRRRKKR